jgi:hypothetical protein
MFPMEVQIPFQSTRDLSTEGAKTLTYALVNPQQAGPFAQFGDGQLIALKKLAAIFEGALPKHKQLTRTPLLSNTSESPQRVDCTESPHKELTTTSAPRVVEPTSPNKKKLNSHRRLQTTSQRCVTPNHTTRRSAEPLNLSHDMLDETIQQANHVFSIPIMPSNTPRIAQPTQNKIESSSCLKWPMQLFAQTQASH